MRPTRNDSQSELLALQRRLAQAERLAALGALAAALAHELGTPLHSIAGHLDLLRSGPDLTPASRDRLEIVSGEVDRLCALIRKHLRRLRSPQPELRDVNLNELVEHIVEVMRPLLAARSIEVGCDLDDPAAATFPCDPDQVEQVMLNLLQNALDASEGGCRIEVRTAVTDTGRAISVSDNGCGVAPEHIDRVFEPFFSTKRAGHGTGLGLALCREIARNHGGDIVLDSKPGIGTVVTLTLGGTAAS